MKLREAIRKIIKEEIKPLREAKDLKTSLNELVATLRRIESGWSGAKTRKDYYNKLREAFAAYIAAEFDRQETMYDRGDESTNDPYLDSLSDFYSVLYNAKK